MRQGSLLKKWGAAAAILTGAGVLAVTSTEMQIDAEAQRVVSLYGVDESGSPKYNDGILNIPNELVCLLNQLWIPELVGLGNVRAEVNESRCIGNLDGVPAIPAVVNLSVDSVSGQTVGKIWLVKDNAPEYEGKNALTYLKVSVTDSPSPGAPFGRFRVDAVDEDMSDNSELAILEIIANGNEFKLRAKFNTAGDITSFRGYATGVNRQAVYRLNEGELTRAGFDDSHVCFQSGTSAAECFSRSLGDPNARVNAYSYGLYSAEGSRYNSGASNVNLLIDDLDFVLVGGFGGNLTSTATTGGRPGGVTANGSDSVFWTGKTAFLKDDANQTPYEVQWLTKFHAVPLSASVPLGSTAVPSLSAEIDAGLPAVPSSLTPIGKEIGALPSDVLSAPVRVRAGKLLF